jgi:hypothetical protein
MGKWEKALLSIYKKNIRFAPRKKIRRRAKKYCADACSRPLDIRGVFQKTFIANQPEGGAWTILRYVHTERQKEKRTPTCI